MKKFFLKLWIAVLIGVATATVLSFIGAGIINLLLYYSV